MKKRVLCGIDRIDSIISDIKGMKIGLLTNHTGVNKNLVFSSEILKEYGLLSCLFAPEHGLYGNIQAGEKVFGSTDPYTGSVIYSLYGNSEEDEKIFSSLDAFAFDIQDVGARFYTYIATLSRLMEKAGKLKKPVIIFDRMNPITSTRTEGAILENDCKSGVGRFNVPARHSMSVAEYALFINDTLDEKCELIISKCEGTEEDLYLDDTDIPFISPSPNLPTVDSCICYIGTCIFEGTNISEGRGTTKPFEMIGAPFIEGKYIAEKMNKMDLPGVIFRPCFFTPTFSKHSSLVCEGVQMHITDRSSIRPFESALSLADLIFNTYDDAKYRDEDKNGRSFFDLILGTKKLRKNEITLDDFIKKCETDSLRFLEEIKKYRLYT